MLLCVITKKLLNRCDFADWLNSESTNMQAAAVLVLTICLGTAAVSFRFDCFRWQAVWLFSCQIDDL